MRHLTALVLLLSALTSCESDNAATNNSGNNQSLTGILTGRIELYSTEGSYVFDRQGVSVSIDGTSIRVTTTADGKWIMPNLPAGIYDFTFEKPGYGSEKVIGYQFTGGGTAYFDAVDLRGFNLNKILLDYFFMYPYDNTLVLSTGGISQPNLPATLLFSLSTDKAKLLSDPDNAEIEFTTNVESSASGSFTTGFKAYTTEFFDTVSSGTILYVTARILSQGKNLNKHSGYFDPIRYKWIFSSAGPISDILSDTIP